MVKSGGFHGKDLYTAYLACNRLIMYICIGSDFDSDEKYSIQWYTMKSGGFHGKDLYTAYFWLIMYICIGSDFGSDEKYSIQW